METIQVVLDKKLLLATDRAARRARRNRSALIRDAIRHHLRRLNVLRMEDLDRQGYAAQPHEQENWRKWEAEAVWPEE